MAYFRTPDDIATEMLADHLDLTTQAGAPVSLKITDIDRPEVVKYKTDASALSQVLGCLDQVSDDFFPGSATEPGLENHLAERQMPPRISAQPATVQIKRTGTVDAVIGVEDQMVRVSDGTYWQAQSQFSIGGDGTGIGTYQSLLTGQVLNSENINDPYNAVSTLTGVDSPGVSTSAAQNGRDLETPAEMLARIVAHDQNPNSGGNLAAYEQWASEASPLVVTANADHTGADEVTVYITSGTTDIEAALRADSAVERLPSDDLIATVETYIEAKDPTTDTAIVAGPTEAAFDITFNYDLYDETQRTAVDPEVQLLTKLFIYTCQGNQTYSPTDLERLIQGRIGFLMPRMRASNFAGAVFAYTVPAETLLRPGAITTGPIS